MIWDPITSAFDSMAEINLQNFCMFQKCTVIFAAVLLEILYDLCSQTIKLTNDGNFSIGRVHTFC